MKNRGYTLVEILVVLGVTALLSGLLFVYSRQGEKIGEIMRVRAQVVSDINRVKNLAITAATWQGQLTCGYGIYFDIPNNQYIIFTDISADCKSSNHLRNQAQTQDVERIKTPQRFTLVNTNVQQVFFMPPQPFVFFDGQAAEKQSAIEEVEITFGYLSDIDPAFKVYINSIGQTWAY
ncbi:MAG: prepilin-type N-terminal cleavage/methylation domain-containing protein [Patescibacteria group bacterium]|jgi:prepilin-type N-terminal cleavage/methylation domain-containing protein|nr:prepilin-type N-terminal cleavage/methylation domain-containing protein [Patescibacteria group bacterium]